MLYNLKNFVERSSSKSDATFNAIVSEVIAPDWENGPWLAGGAVRRRVCDLPYSDFDVFFSSQEQCDAWMERIRNTFKVISEKCNDNNTTFVLKFADREITVQSIHRFFYSSPAFVIASFDFTICQWITDGDKLMVGEYTLWDTARKRLAINDVTFAVSTVRRMIKYAQQGFTACGGMIADVLTRVSESPDIINQEVVSLD